MKRILAIDGGGIRGLIPAVVCQKLEAWSNSKIHELFDLIAGTSTGGILALGLASPPEGVPAKEMADFYKKAGPEIFSRPRGLMRYVSGPKYSNEKLKEALDKQFGSLKLSQAKVDVHITGYDIGRRRPIYFTKAKAIETPSEDYYMRDIAVATSAAPTYFEPANVGDHVVIDGGLAANNPACAAYAHAKQLWPEEQVTMVSLGTGTLTPSIFSDDAKSWGTVRWAEPVIDCAFDGNAKATEDFFRYTHRSHYWRFQGDLSEVTQSLDGVSPSSIHGLEQIGERIAYTGENQLIELAALLKRAGKRLTAKIHSPLRESVVQSGKCFVSGSIADYENELLYLFTGTREKYWPSGRIKPENGQWQGQVNVGTAFPEGTITLAAVDQRLAEYIDFYRSNAQAIGYPGMPIREFPNHLDRIHVLLRTTPTP